MAANFVRRFVLHNLPLKVLSLLVAIGLWFGVAREPVAEVALSVPIEFHNAPENLEISSETIPQVQVRVRGPVRTVRELAPTEVHAIIDMEGARPPERTYDLTPSRIVVPKDVEIVQVVPSQFRVEFDTRMTKQVEVHPRVLGTFATGFRIENVSTDPRYMTVVGPAKHVATLDAVSTDPVDASGVVAADTFRTHAYISDPMVRFVGSSEVRVTVVTQRGRGIVPPAVGHKP